VSFTRGQWAGAVSLALFTHLGVAYFLSLPEGAPPSPQPRPIALARLASATTVTATRVAPETTKAVPTDALLTAAPPSTSIAMDEVVTLHQEQSKSELTPVRSAPKPEPAPAPTPERGPKPEPNTKPNPKRVPDVAEVRTSRQWHAAGRHRTEPSAAHKPSVNGENDIDAGAVPARSNRAPRYPTIARRRGYEGRVIIQVTVLPNGGVGRATVKRGSGYRVLDKAALKAVQRWRFQPAERNGRPTRATLDVPIVFQLEQG
jgi:protein TonB